MPPCKGQAAEADGQSLDFDKPPSSFLMHHLCHHHASLRHGWWTGMSSLAKIWTCNSSFTLSTAETRLEAFKLDLVEEMGLHREGKHKKNVKLDSFIYKMLLFTLSLTFTM